ncbi:G-protein alpha subunit-domain-containing protein [Mycena haematopus]|nr:G-protein alpha subunit-domain-containing protein [Mycena haematopus]
MGACASQPDRASKARSDEIDRQLDEDSKRYKKECKILLLGSGESGKSTIVKQMKIIHQTGFSVDELRAFRRSTRTQSTRRSRLYRRCRRAGSRTCWRTGTGTCLRRSWARCSVRRRRMIFLFPSFSSRNPPSTTSSPRPRLHVLLRFLRLRRSTSYMLQLTRRLQCPAERPNELRNAVMTTVTNSSLFFSSSRPPAARKRTLRR